MSVFFISHCEVCHRWCFNDGVQALCQEHGGCWIQLGGGQTNMVPTPITARCFDSVIAHLTGNDLLVSMSDILHTARVAGRYATTLTAYVDRALPSQPLSLTDVDFPLAASFPHGIYSDHWATEVPAIARMATAPLTDSEVFGLFHGLGDVAAGFSQQPRVVPIAICDRETHSPINEKSGDCVEMMPLTGSDASVVVTNTMDVVSLTAATCGIPPPVTDVAPITWEAFVSGELPPTIAGWRSTPPLTPVGLDNESVAGDNAIPTDPFLQPPIIDRPMLPDDIASKDVMPLHVLGTSIVDVGATTNEGDVPPIHVPTQEPEDPFLSPSRRGPSWYAYLLGRK